MKSIKRSKTAFCGKSPLVWILQSKLWTSGTNKDERNVMLYWTIVFLIIALVAGVLGFGGIAGTAMGIAQVLFVIFLVLFLVSLILSLSRK